MFHHRHRRAFSLIELLVVIAIISILLALLIPAVQKVRAAADLTQCSNNLHQISVALHNYHGTHLSFPAGGWITAPKNIGWSAEILPLMEQQNVWSKIQFDLAYNNAANTAAGNTIVPNYICPSVPRSNPWRRDTGDSTDFAVSDYGGMYGERGLSSPTSNNNPPRGVMIFNQTISLNQITDGASQTIQVGEAPDSIHGIWISGHNIYDQSAAINAKPAVEFGTELSSYHSGGANALFADGSVHFLANGLDTKILAALCTRNGNDIVDGSY